MVVFFAVFLVAVAVVVVLVVVVEFVEVGNCIDFVIS